RNLPSLLAYVEKHNKLPKRLVFSLAALISFYEGVQFEGSALKGERDGKTYLIQDDHAILTEFAAFYQGGGSTEEKAERLATSVLSNTGWWGEDLSKVEGLAALVESYLKNIWKKGMQSALKEVL
ncbi:MAG: tagaturonate reductase, partial [Spirochaetales bacterium]|nr:tagaturonate reductase [Spirochaetales bacterium]